MRAKFRELTAFWHRRREICTPLKVVFFLVVVAYKNYSQSRDNVEIVRPFCRGALKDLVSILVPELKMFMKSRLLFLIQANDRRFDMDLYRGSVITSFRLYGQIAAFVKIMFINDRTLFYSLRAKNKINGFQNR